MRINKPSLWGLIFIGLCFVLSGCTYAPALLPMAVPAGIDAVNAIEDADIDSAVSPECNKDDFKQIKKIVVIFNERNKDLIDLTNSVSDSLTVELMKLGFDVVERRNLDSAVGGSNLQQKDLDLHKISKTLGVNAIVTGSVTATMKGGHGYLFGGWKMNYLVQNASLKIIDCRKNRTMMVITINYKNGQKPRDAAQSMAKLLKQKIDDPFG